jgi:hypothetical protein
MDTMLRKLIPVGFALVMPFVMGARGDGCAANSRSPAPDTTGTWGITYDDRIGVEIKIGGAVYTDEIGAQGGVITIDHEGTPITFDLDCARPDIICPSEGWPAEVYVEQRNEEFEHRMIVTLPTQSCSGALIAPAPGTCGEGTLNPDCEQVCDGEVTTRNEERFGVIGETGDSFRLYLGAGLATNGINCALLAWSVADADLVTEGEGTEAWVANEMTNGLVTVGYAGGCLWAGQTDPDPQLEALVIGASITFTTGFTGARLD